MRIEPLGRLAAIAGRPAAAIDLAQNILRVDLAALDLDVLEHRFGDAEFAGKHLHGVVVVF